MTGAAGADWSSPFGYQPLPGPWLRNGYSTHWLQTADMFFVLMLTVPWWNWCYRRGTGAYLGERSLTVLACWLLRRPTPPPTPEMLASPAGRRRAARG